MNQRIRTVRDSLKMSRSAFGEALGVSGDVINNLERGRVEPKESIIKLICNEFGISAEWLRNGVGNMYQSEDRTFVGKLAKEYGLSEPERLMIEKFIALPDESRAGIIEYIVETANALKGIETAHQREARLLREEADAVEKEGERLSASPWRKEA